MSLYTLEKLECSIQKKKSNESTVMLHSCRGVVCSFEMACGFQSVTFILTIIMRQATYHIQRCSDTECVHVCVLIGACYCFTCTYIFL